MKMNRVLIVDDSEDSLYFLRALLQGYGYEVVTASQGAEALDKARQNPPDLIITDILMPVMDGFSLCREWKKDARLRPIPFVFYTATYTDERDRRFALSLGAERFIIKPEEPEAFMAIIQETLQQVESQPAPTIRPAAEAPGKLPIVELEEEAVCLKEYNEALIRRVEAKMEELEQANRELEQKITEGTQAADALQRSEANLKEALLAAEMGVWEWTRATDTVTWDENLYRIAGRDPKLPAPTYREHPQVYAPKSWQRLEAAVENALATGTPYAVDLELIRPDGSKRWVIGRGEPLRDASGHMVGLRGTVQDITQRKQAEALLTHERDLLHALMDSVPDKIFFKDTASRFVRINRAHALSMGLKDSSEALGKTDFDFHPGEMAEGTLREEKRVLETGEPLVGKIEAYTKPDGRIRWNLVTKAPIKDKQGQVVGLVGISSDISERMRTEAELRRTSEVLRTVFQASPLAIIAGDRSLRVQMWNPAAERLFGWTEAEVLGEPLPIIPESRREEFRAEIDGLLRGETITPFESQRLRKDGSLVEVSISTGVLRDASGEAIGVVGIFMDLTQHKAMEAQLRQKAKMEAIGQLAGGVAHDFNNLLTVIAGYGQILRARLKSKELVYLEEILKASDQAAALTGQLLAFSRRQILAPQVLDLNSVVASMEEMLRRVIGEDVELVTVPQPGLGLVKADRGQIEQVIINLAVNARDAMPRGGRLTIETAEVDLDEAYAETHAGAIPGPHVMLAVSDTGVGMNSEILAHLFEPFFTTKETGKGTGLGLATVYGIVRQSGGSIWADSEPGRGTTMRIYLPRVEEALPEERPRETPSEQVGGSETVLVVEDEDGVRSLVSETLASHGYKVLEAKEPNQALLMLGQYAEPIHLLLTDVVMPQMSGRNLAKHMRTVHPEARVLYMSGYTDKAIVQDGILEGGTHFLQKPFVPDALARKVREILDTKPEKRA